MNGEVVWSDDGLDGPGHRVYGDRLDLPDAGWVAVRTFGGSAGWPSMHMMPFAHTGPAWIGEVGSIEPAARALAVAELLEVLDVSEHRLIEGYGDSEIPKLRARFGEARRRLEALRDGGS